MPPALNTAHSLSHPVLNNFPPNIVKASQTFDTYTYLLTYLLQGVHFYITIIFLYLLQFTVTITTTSMYLCWCTM